MMEWYANSKENCKSGQAVLCGPLSIISSLVMMKFRNKCSGAFVNEKVNKFVFVV